MIAIFYLCIFYSVSYASTIPSTNRQPKFLFHHYSTPCAITTQGERNVVSGFNGIITFGKNPFENLKLFFEFNRYKHDQNDQYYNPSSPSQLLLQPPIYKPPTSSVDTITSAAASASASVATSSINQNPVILYPNNVKNFDDHSRSEIPRLIDFQKLRLNFKNPFIIF